MEQAEVTLVLGLEPPREHGLPVQLDCNLIASKPQRQPIPGLRLER
jgi:hypothetical protein